jgi:hypothetical protein
MNVRPSRPTRAALIAVVCIFKIAAISYCQSIARHPVQRKLVGYIDPSGTLVIPMAYEAGCRFTEGLAAVRQKELWGFIDADGKTVIPLIYNDALPFLQGRAAVKVGEKWGYIDKTGATVVSPFADAACSFSGDMARVEISGRVTFVLSDGRVLTERYSAADSASENLAAVQIDGKWGYIDDEGLIQIAPQFAYAGPFNRGRASVYDGKTCAVIDRKGTVIAKDFEMLSDCYDGFMTFKKDGKWGLLKVADERPTIVMEAKYDAIGIPREGLVPAQINGLWGYFGMDGKEAISPTYNTANPFFDGLAVVGNGEACGMIDQGGSLVIPVRFTMLSRFEGDLASCATGWWLMPRFKYIDRGGRVVWPKDGQWIGVKGLWALGFLVLGVLFWKVRRKRLF